MKLVLDLVLVSSRLDIRRVDSLNVFKNSMVNYLNLLHYNPLKLNCCALNYYLFRINCVPYPGCICGFQDETIKDFFLYFPRFAALRQILLSSVAQYFYDTWRHMSESQKVNILLFGSSQLSLQENIVIFCIGCTTCRRSMRCLHVSLVTIFVLILRG